MEIVILALVVAILVLWHIYSKRIDELSSALKSRLEQVDKQQEKIAQLQHEYESAMSRIQNCNGRNTKLKEQLDVARRELEFYKNIEEDSAKLNTQSYKGSTEEREKNQLDSEQLFALEKMEHSSNNFLVTGKAGTGKSFLLDAFRNTTNKKHAVLAPTGIAALNVKGATLHSVFGYKNLVELDVDRISERNVGLSDEKRLVLKTVGTIIIDEISMVRADTFDKIDRILKVINHSELPFGGKQILLFGDLFQLPPVTKGEEYNYLFDRYGGVYFFCSDAYKNGNFGFMELTVNHRQKEDAEYFSLLNRIRDGSVTHSDIKVLNSRVVKDESVFDRFTTLLPTKAEVEKLNRYHIDQLNSESFTYSAKIVLDKRKNKNQNLEKVFPIVASLCLKKGALIMMVANDPEHRWVNGTLGIVKQLTNDRILVAINKQICEIHPMDFTEQEITYVDGKITYEDILKIKQYPIVPAYAITIHKSQGQTYQNIVCDIDRCFASGQAYVALSRCASLNGLHLKKPISGASIRVDRSVVDFYRHNQRINDRTLESITS